MEPLENVLSEWIRAGVGKAFPELAADVAKVGVVATASDGFGDYQCNAAMGLAKQLRRSPREVAQAVATAAGAHAAVERIEVAGPGFLNIFLSGSWLDGHMADVARDPRCGVPAVGVGHTVVLDYSSPNVAKPMHIGHIRSTVIGNALDRMHRFLGYRVIADNHLGDWGTQFGILIMGYRHFVDRARLAEEPVEELERIYVRSYERSKEDAGWMDQARAELVKLQSGDPENLRLWQQFVALSLAEFDHMYKRLGVGFDLTRGESYYSDVLAGLADEMIARGIARESEGALVVFLEEEKLPVCMVRKSDGGFNYATTDLATIRSRIGEFKPDKIIYVTDERQQLHFKQVFATARRLGLHADFEHVWFGLMRLPEGTFSTRQGNVIKLERLLDEAESRALAIVKETSPEQTPERQREVARVVGIGAVKYADLSQSPQTLVTFSWDKALALNGNSAPYLQYAYARIASVRDKYQERFPQGRLDDYRIELKEPVERALGLKIARFPEALIRAADSYKPNVLADYLYELAQTYSTFYQNVPFLQAPEGARESRVRLSVIVARILQRGLNLLGIETLERI